MKLNEFRVRLGYLSGLDVLIFSWEGSSGVEGGAPDFIADSS